MKKALYLSLFVMLLSTCKKDTSLPEPENFYYYLTKEQLNKTPYFTNPKFDTLTFISNKGDTLVFAKAGTDTFWYKSYDFSPSGYSKIFHYQQLGNSYTTLKGEGKFEVNFSRMAVPTGLGYPIPNILEIFFNGYVFNFSEESFGNKFHKYFLGDLSIESDSFFNVFFEYNKEDVSSKVVGYYSTNNGFFQYSDSTINSVVRINF